MSMPVSDFSANQNLTLEEFQRFAETHEGMWELYDGVPVRMQSPSPEHQWICHEVMSQFREYFRKNPRLHSVGKQSKIPVNESLQGGADERHDGPV